jgi:hypothetical protein
MCEPKKQAAPGFEMCAGGFECAPGEVHPWHKPAMPTQEQFKNSPTYPVIVTPNPMATKQVIYRLLMFISADACRQHAWTQQAVACAAAATATSPAATYGRQLKLQLF